jgi:hypothetical protein
MPDQGMRSNQALIAKSLSAYDSREDLHCLTRLDWMIL